MTLVGSGELASLAESALSGFEVSDGEISAELAPCFVGDGASDAARTDTVVLACTHYPLLMDRLVRLAPWPVDWVDSASAIARRVADLLGAPGNKTDYSGVEVIFTSRRPRPLNRALMPFAITDWGALSVAGVSDNEKPRLWGRTGFLSAK